MCNFSSPDSTPVPEYSPTCWYSNVATSATEEQLKTTSISELEMMRSTLAGVIKILQAKGDNRWEEIAEQQRKVNKALTSAIKTKRSLDGIVEPESVVTHAECISMKSAITKKDGSK